MPRKGQGVRFLVPAAAPGHRGRVSLPPILQAEKQTQKSKHQAQQPGNGAGVGAGAGRADGPAGGTHLTADVTDGHMDKDRGLFHPLQVHVPVT